MTPVILHVDMDAFFASVEVRDDPSLRGKPVLVGGAGRRGVVAAASYEAREFGCHSAQPMAVARRLCPRAVVIPPRGHAYAEASRQVFEVFDRFSPLVEGLSIDEAFLDLTGTDRLHGPPRLAGEALRRVVFEETALTCSVGIATVKFIAKIASDMNKPNGLTEVPPGEEKSFLALLPVGTLWGVGPRAREVLHQRGIRTVGDLAATDPGLLQDWFGVHGMHLHRLSHAIDEREVVPGRAAKSISHEDTYAVDVEGEPAIRRKLLSQSVRVADRLAAKGLRGRRVQLKIRDTDFTTETRQRVLPSATNQSKVIYETACEVLGSVELAGRRFRLTGVGVGHLERDDGDGQLDLLDGTTGAAPRDQAVQDVQAEIRRRYGHEALFPADAGAATRPGSTGAISNTREDDPTD